MATGLLMAALSVQSAPSAPPALQAPNVVEIGPALVTSGQPSAAALAGLGRLGFQAVVYLAPSTVADAVADEPRIVTEQGLAFVHIPIPFDAPTEAHVDAVAEALTRLAGRRTLVHCQVNLRASSMVFLYRAIVQRVPPADAYEAVARVWSPGGPWRTLITEQLRRHGIAFTPY